MLIRKLFLFLEKSILISSISSNREGYLLDIDTFKFRLLPYFGKKTSLAMNFGYFDNNVFMFDVK